MRTQPVEVHRPQVDVEVQPPQVFAQPVLQLGLGLDAGDAWHRKEVKQQRAYGALVEGGQRGRLGWAQCRGQSQPPERAKILVSIVPWLAEIEGTLTYA